MRHILSKIIYIYIYANLGVKFSFLTFTCSLNYFVCMYVWVIVFVWRSVDNLWELLLFFQSVGSGH